MAHRTPQVQVAHISAEDKGRTRRPLWAYGPFFVARIAGRARRTVRLAQKQGVPFHDPVEAVAWALAKKKRPDLADAVLETLGYDRRWS